MDKIQKWQADIRALDAKVKALMATAAADGERDFTAEEDKTVNGYLDQIEALKVKITTEERTQAALSAAEPQARVEIHDNADEAPYSFGEFLLDVRASAITHEKRPRLVRHEQRNAEIVRKEFRASSGLNEALPADGGFLVGTDFASGLIQKVYDNSQIAKLCQKVQLSGNSNSMKLNGVDETSRADGSRFGGVQGYWVAEGVAPTASKPKFRQIELNLKKVAVLYYATDEALSDASVLEQHATSCVLGELDFKLQDALINGNGAGKPMGILNSPCLVTIDKETGQKADSIVAENISKMWGALWARSRPNAIWFINQEDEQQLDKLSIPVGTGGTAVYMPAGGLSDAPYGRLKGRPVIPIEQCAALGDKGDIILADFSEYQLADKGGVQMASSMHVLFTTDEMAFRFIYRVDGQPLWNSALTPYKGAQTLSPFVTLAARA